MKRAYIDILIRYLYLYITDIYKIKRHQWDWADKKEFTEIILFKLFGDHKKEKYNDSQDIMNHIPDDIFFILNGYDMIYLLQYVDQNMYELIGQHLYINSYYLDNPKELLRTFFFYHVFRDTDNMYNEFMVKCTI